MDFQQLSVSTDELVRAPSTGAIDGNRVDVIATLHNHTSTAQTTDVQFGDPVDDSSSTGITQSNVSVPSGGSVNVDEVLDTSGLAWNDGGGARVGRVTNPL